MNEKLKALVQKVFLCKRNYPVEKTRLEVHNVPFDSEISSVQEDSKNEVRNEIKKKNKKENFLSPRSSKIRSARNSRETISNKNSSDVVISKMDSSSNTGKALSEIKDDTRENNSTGLNCDTTDKFSSVQSVSVMMGSHQDINSQSRDDNISNHSTTDRLQDDVSRQSSNIVSKENNSTGRSYSNSSNGDQDRSINSKNHSIGNNKSEVGQLFVTDKASGSRLYVKNKPILEKSNKEESKDQKEDSKNQINFREQFDSGELIPSGSHVDLKSSDRNNSQAQKSNKDLIIESERSFQSVHSSSNRSPSTSENEESSNSDTSENAVLTQISSEQKLTKDESLEAFIMKGRLEESETKEESETVEEDTEVSCLIDFYDKKKFNRLLSKKITEILEKGGKKSKNRKH